MHCVTIFYAGLRSPNTLTNKSGSAEASTTRTFAPTTASFSETVQDVALKFNHATSKIEALDDDVRSLGSVLSQLDRFVTEERHRIDPHPWRSIASIKNECNLLFKSIEIFKNAIYSKAGGPEGTRLTYITLRGEHRWYSEAVRLQVLQAQISGAKLEIWLLMNPECLQTDDRFVWQFPG